MALADIVALYARLRDAAGRQLAALQAEDIELFLRVTDEREAIFADVRAREGELVGIADARLAEIRKLISEILADDDQIQVAAGAIAAQTQEELALVQQGLQALGAYAESGISPAYFIDHSG